jgi:RNA polymerase sigma-70 factor (ECF subfamily)
MEVERVTSVLERESPVGVRAHAPEDFAELYAKHFARMSRTLLLMTGDVDEAFDLVQEAFARTWKEWPRVRRFDRPDLFTLKVARNLARSGARRRALLRRLWPLLAQSPTFPSEPGADTDTRLAFATAIEKVTPREREAISLCLVAGLSSEEAAKIMRASASTVRVLVARGKEKVRDLLHLGSADEGASREGEDA